MKPYSLSRSHAQNWLSRVFTYLTFFVACSAFSAYAQVGTILHAAADAQARDKAGSLRPLAAGNVVDVGDTLLAGGGQLQLRLIDGAQIAIYARAELSLDKYQHKPNDGADDSAVMTLLRGTLRTITGLVGKQNPAGYSTKAASATVGIRGTEYLLSVDGEAVTAEVTEGIITVTTPFGAIELRAGEAAEVKNRAAAPRKVERADAASARQTVAELSTREIKDRLAEARNADRQIDGSLNVATALDARDNTNLIIVGRDLVAGATATQSRIVLPSATLLDGNVSAVGPYRLGDRLEEAYRDNYVLWGRWSSPAGSDAYGLPFATQHHYVGGRATSAADMNALTASNTSAVYTLLGATAPTTDGVADGANVRANLTVNFSAQPTANLSLVFDAAGRRYDFNTPNITVLPGQSRLVSGGLQPGDTLSINGQRLGLNAAGNTAWNYGLDGFFYGPAAARAGISYAIADLRGATPIRTLGALVFCKGPRC